MQYSVPLDGIYVESIGQRQFNDLDMQQPLDLRYESSNFKLVLNEGPFIEWPDIVTCERLKQDLHCHSLLRGKHWICRMDGLARSRKVKCPLSGPFILA